MTDPIPAMNVFNMHIEFKYVYIFYIFIFTYHCIIIKTIYIHVWYSYHKLKVTTNWRHHWSDVNQNCMHWSYMDIFHGWIFWWWRSRMWTRSVIIASVRSEKRGQQQKPCTYDKQWYTRLNRCNSKRHSSNRSQIKSSKSSFFLFRCLVMKKRLLSLPICPALEYLLTKNG